MSNEIKFQEALLRRVVILVTIVGLVSGLIGVFIGMRYHNLKIKKLYAEEKGKSSGHIILDPGTGNVGIGTTTPTEKLDVAGNVRASGVIAPGVIAQVQSTYATGVNEFSATTWTPIPGTAVTITTTGGRVLLLANVEGEAIGGDSWAFFTIRRNGVNISPLPDGFAVSVSHGHWNYMHPMMWVDHPPAGTYTYDLAIKRGGPYNYRVEEWNPSVLIAIEIRQ